MSTQSVLEYASRKIGGVPRLPPVVGGSGRRYWTIAAALSGESAFAITVAGVVPQAGTQAGVVVFQAGQSAVNDFYKDRYVLDTDATPTNGLVAQWSRISNYVGATRTATLDKPWDFSAESSVDIIQPAKIALEEDVTEDVSVTIPLELDLQGHKITGKIDVTAGQFLWVRGGAGFVTNGIQKADFGLLKIDDCTVSRRDATIYALLLTSGSNLGRCELINNQFMGRVAGRRGFSGWKINNCVNFGVTDGTTDLPYTLVESVVGVAIVLSQLDVDLNTELGGAILYSENSITGATAFMSVAGSIESTHDFFTISQSPRKFSIVKAINAATLDVTTTAGGIVFAVRSSRPIAVPSLSNIQFTSFVNALNFSGTLQFLVNTTFEISFVGRTQPRMILIEGTSNMTGAVTFGGSATKRVECDGAANMRMLGLAATVTGTVTWSGGTVVMSRASAAGYLDTNTALQNAGAPVIIISAALDVNHCGDFSGSGSNLISVGTWTFSGIAYYRWSSYSAVFLWSASGGTVTFSGSTSVHNGTSSNATNPSSISLLNYTGTGGTGTVSGTSTITGGLALDFCICRVAGSGGTGVVSGVVILASMELTSTTGLILSSTGATSSATVSSSVFISYIHFEGVVTLVTVTNAGASGAGPTQINFYHCSFEGTLDERSGAGTITYGASAALRVSFCIIRGLFTFTATPFTTIELFESRFNGNASNKSITATGTRPTTFRMWKCSWAARYDDLQPEVLSEYDVLPAQAALVQGQPVKINAANQYQVCVAASIVDGVALAAAGGAGTILIALRQGRAYVTCKAGTLNGDNLVLDLATPTQANQGAFLAGQEIGTALENVGAVVAGKCYTAVNVR